MPQKNSRLLNLDEVKGDDEKVDLTNSLEALKKSLEKSPALMAQKALQEELKRFSQAMQSNSSINVLSSALKDIKKQASIVNTIVDSYNLPDYQSQRVPIEVIDSIEVRPHASKEDIDNINLKLQKIEAKLNEIPNTKDLTNVNIFCKTCNNFLISIKYAVVARVYCQKCQKMRDIPSKSVVIKPQKIHN